MLDFIEIVGLIDKYDIDILLEYLVNFAKN